MSVDFLGLFYLNEEELNQQVCLIKYAENEISNSTSLSLSLSLSLKKQKQSNFKIIISKTPEKLSPQVVGLLNAGFYFFLTYFLIWDNSEENPSSDSY